MTQLENRPSQIHNSTEDHPGVIIIGAGPAGLTAAYELSKKNLAATVLEADDIVGGIARTANYKGYLFDMGGHRFFTKVSIVEQMWKEILGSDLLSRPRSSRIYYKSKFFNYPLEPKNALFGLGVIEASRCTFSYAAARLFPTKPEESVETWVSNRFGKRLFNIFFKTYTEKVWGMPCKEIRADWAAQRIKDLSLKSAILNALKPKKGNQSKEKVIKTLINEFLYPRRGPGMMWEKTRDIVEARGSRVWMETPVEKIYWEPGRVKAVQAGGQLFEGRHFISSMPIRDLIERLDPAPPEKLRQAAADLHYRDFLTVALILRDKNVFSDNWIYVHEPGVKVGRIQNYKSWSPEMVPDPSTNCLGLEYFCFEGDGLWNMDDKDLIALGRKELSQLGLASAGDFIDGTVVRVKKAYPVYDETYQRALTEVRDFVAGLPNLQLVGRNGMHRYNNQDHSMLTAILAARNIMGASYDLWQVNVDAEYHESGTTITEEEVKAMEATQPSVPGRVAQRSGAL
ncbi:MAG: NAD(P)/FAD-dependent oxidoreductase [Bryobacteraceae bacterium]